VGRPRRREVKTIGSEKGKWVLDERGKWPGIDENCHGEKTTGTRSKVEKVGLISKQKTARISMDSYFTTIGGSRGEGSKKNKVDRKKGVKLTQAPKKGAHIRREREVKGGRTAFTRTGQTCQKSAEWQEQYNLGGPKGSSYFTLKRVKS